jgi:ABC-2 type transport system permease protein
MFAVIAAGHRVRSLLLRRRLAYEAQLGASRLVGLAALGVGLAAVVFGGAFGGGAYVRIKEAPELLLSGTSAVLWGLAAALVFSSLGHAAQAFFQAKDLWLWDSAPTGAGPRFVDRFTETAVAALPPTLALGSLGLVGYVVGGGLGVGGALRAVVAILLTAPLPVAIGVAVAHIGGAVLPAGRLRRLSLLLLGVSLTAVLVWFRQARVERLLSEEGAHQLLQTAKSTGPLGPSFAPPQLLARFVVDGDVFGFVVGVGSVAAIVGAAFALHVLLYDRARKLAVDESPSGVRPGSLAERLLLAVTAPLPTDLMPLVRKDLLAFVRDPAQWSQVVLLLGVGVLYVVNASALEEGLTPLAPPWGGIFLAGAHTGIVGFIAGGLAVRFAFPQLGLEGPAVWILDGAPVPAGRLLLAKWCAAVPVVVVYPVVLGVVGAVVLGFSPARVLWTSAWLVVFAFGVAALGVFRGARAPLFDAASLSELAMGPGAVSTMVLATVFAFVGSIATLVAAGLFAFRARLGAPAVVGGIAVMAVAVAVVVVAARAAFHAAVLALARRRTEPERSVKHSAGSLDAAA